MNAAARLVHQNSLSRHLVLTRLLTRWQMMTLFLTFSILFSALGVIYVTHSFRLMNASYQNLLQENHRLHVKRTQLLLERSAEMIPGKIQALAENELSMVMPSHQSIIVVHE